MHPLEVRSLILNEKTTMVAFAPCKEMPVLLVKKVVKKKIIIGRRGGGACGDALDDDRSIMGLYQSKHVSRSFHFQASLNCRANACVCLYFENSTLRNLLNSL
jgi:hypothetical protein